MPSGTANASNWQRVRQSPQPAHTSSSTTATKAEAAIAVGMANSATLRSTPQQQVQQFHM
jgi:hypothetical protein